MTFTDDDLKRLKELMFTEFEIEDIDAQNILNLLARLEAAERAIFSLQIIRGCCLMDKTHFHGDEDSLVKAWRKSAGKDK